MEKAMFWYNILFTANFTIACTLAIRGYFIYSIGWFSAAFSALAAAKFQHDLYLASKSKEEEPEESEVK